MQRRHLKKVSQLIINKKKLEQREFQSGNLEIYASVI